MYKHIVLFCIVIIRCRGLDIYNKCGESIKCVENKLVESIDEIDNNTISIAGDFLVLQKTNDEVFVPKSEEGIFERAVRYISNHELKLRLPSEVNPRGLIEEARKRKLRKLMLPILLLLKLKALVILPAVLFAIALVAFKGMGTGFMALIISGVLALKSLFEKHHSSSAFSYEVVPQIASPGWNRNGVPLTDGWTGIIQ